MTDEPPRLGDELKAALGLPYTATIREMMLAAIEVAKHRLPPPPPDSIPVRIAVALDSRRNIYALPIHQIDRQEAVVKRVYEAMEGQVVVAEAIITAHIPLSMISEVAGVVESEAAP